MEQFEKVNDEIVNIISSKLINYIKDLYSKVKNSLPYNLTEYQIKIWFKYAIMNSYNLKEIVILNINNLDIIKSLEKEKSELSIVYTRYLTNKIMNKFYKLLNTELFNEN